MDSDLDLLQGHWSVTALEMEGQKIPPAMLAGASIVVQGNRFTSTGMGAVYEGILDIDSSTTPRQFDMRFDAGPEEGNTNLGIYELAGDSWKVCLATRGTVRPGGFASAPGSGIAIETLTRATAVQDSPAAADGTAVTEFEGEWRMVSGIMSGETMDEPLVKIMKRVTRGSRTTVYAGPQLVLQMDFTTDSTKSPKTIDYKNTAG
jgi:hypothetical protein